MLYPKEKFTLKKHQIYASEMMDNVNCLALFYEAGTGKTACVLDWAYRAVERGELNSLLVVCPANIVGVWESSMDKMIYFEGYTLRGIERLKSVTTIRSFQKLYRTVKNTVNHRDGTKTEKKIMEIRPDVDRYWGAMVVDESHSIGIHSSRQTKASIALGMKASKRFILTGTPISGGGGGGDYKKLYGQLKFLDPSVWKSYSDFCDRYVTRFDDFRKPVMYREAELKQLMQDYGIVARLDMCYDMPEATDVIIPCSLAEPVVYKNIREGRTEEYNFEITNGGGHFIKLMELVSGHIKDADGNVLRFKSDKAEALKTIIEGTDDKIVVFCNYRESIDIAKEVCEQFGETVVFDGRSRGQTWREFQDGSARYLICQYQSGGVGIDLYASHTMVFFEPSLSSLLLEQARARIRRKGQTNHCMYYWLSTSKTLEEKTIQIVKEGANVTAEMLESWAMEESRSEKSSSSDD